VDWTAASRPIAHAGQIVQMAYAECALGVEREATDRYALYDGIGSMWIIGGSARHAADRMERGDRQCVFF
jgi:hypothetical protein